MFKPKHPDSTNPNIHIHVFVIYTIYKDFICYFIIGNLIIDICNKFIINISCQYYHRTLLHISVVQTLLTL